MVKVSIIVPVYNTEKYLDRCMNSLTTQTLKEIEIIIIDDGSKKECADLCDIWASKDPRITVVHKTNEGLGFARNTGLEKACGEYVTFVDSDDFVDVDMYERLYQRVKKEQADIIVGGYEKVYNDGQKEKCNNEGIPEVISGEEVKSVLLANMLGAPPEYHSDDYIGMSTCKNLYKKEIIDKFQITFPSERQYISEDMIFQIRYLEHVGKAVVVSDTFYHYCQNGNSISHSYSADRFKRIVQLYQAEVEMLKEIDALSVGRLQLERTFIANARTSIMFEAAEGKRTNNSTGAKKNIKQYCGNIALQEVLKRYPWRKLPIKQRIFSYFMKKNNAGILYFLASCQNQHNLKKRG